MKFIIDGYNLIRTLPRYTHSRFADEKRAVVRLIKIHPLMKKQSHETIIVFDGYADDENIINDKNIKIIFSDDDSADETIKNIVENSKKPEEIYVVTDDREIRDFIRIMGAKNITIKEFAAAIKQDKEPIKKNIENNKIDDNDAIRITKEFENIWKVK
ncbi:NYN domain-containing protein [Candidatus Desantisbacteria bacterium]|nr:NYN domain-containing protein [Candidatus Desantisbacteria bacterium]